jgi:hypothetical protein
MNDEIKVLDVIWVQRLFIGTFVVAVLVGMDYKFIPYFINLIPFLGWIAGASVGIWIWAQMKHWRLRRLASTAMVLVGTVVTAFLVVDRFGDFSMPEVVPARMIRFHEARFLASSDLLVEFNFPDGSSLQTSIGTSHLDRLPAPGATGKAVIGRGLFGIKYLESVEF